MCAHRAKHVSSTLQAVRRRRHQRRTAAMLLPSGLAPGPPLAFSCFFCSRKQTMTVLSYFVWNCPTQRRNVGTSGSRCTCHNGVQFKNWYFVPKIVLTYCEEKNVQVIKKNFWNSRLKRICKHFVITRTIYSNSERPEEFLVMEWFFNLFLEVSRI